MSEVCIRCGIGRNLIIYDNKTFICKSCLDVMRMQKESDKAEKGG